MTTTIAATIDRWERKKAELSRFRAQVDGAALAEEFLADLESLAAGETAVSLSVAASETGYTPDHLSRLIKENKLNNYGRKHAPRVRLSECPRKRRVPGGHVAGQHAHAYHPITDARSLVGARR